MQLVALGNSPRLDSDGIRCTIRNVCSSWFLVSLQMPSVSKDTIADTVSAEFLLETSIIVLPRKKKSHV